MNSKTYFNILGIAPTTDENVIKKAYRKQAFKYHPDRNPSHEANEKFIEITEAYENLLLAIGQAKKQPDNGVPKGKATSATQPREQDFGDLDERLRKARFRYEFIKRKENERAEEYYQSLIKGKKWNAFRIVLFASTILSVLLFADYLLLPKRQEVCTIIKANVDISYNGFGGEDVTPVIFNDNHKVWFPTLIAKKEANKHFHLIKTRLFHEVRSIQYLKNGVWHEVVPNYSFIWIFPVIPLVLLFPLFTYFIKQKSFQFMLCFNLSTYAIPLLIVFTLLSNNRGWHLLTLGLY